MVTWGPPVPTFGCWMEQPRPGSNHPDASNILYTCCMLRCRKKTPNDAIQDGGSLASRSSFRPLPLTRRLDLPPRSTRSREPDGLQLLPCAWSLSAAPPNSQVLIDSLSSPNLSDRGMLLVLDWIESKVMISLCCPIGMRFCSTCVATATQRRGTQLSEAAQIPNLRSLLRPKVRFFRDLCAQ